MFCRLGIEEAVTRFSQMRRCLLRSYGKANAKKPAGGADKNLDWFYAASPRLTRYSMGLREPREILIRFSLYQRM